MSLSVFAPSIGDVSIVPVWPHAGAPSNGTSGTFAGTAQPGDLLVDTTNKVTYQNTNTSASPTWTQLGTGAAVAITGGTIDGVLIGGTTPATGLAVTGAVGTGAGAGNAPAVTGGQGGATGAGGSVSLTGGAGGATSGAGGTVALTGGAGTAGNANGGSIVLTTGALNGTGVNGVIRNEGLIVRQQGAPNAQTVSALLTAANILTGIVTVLQGAAGASALQMPTGTAIQNALPADFGTNDSFDFSVINLSAVSAESASITVNTDVTIVGSAAIPAQASNVQSQGLFRVRKTGNHVFVVYRMA